MTNQTNSIGAIILEQLKMVDPRALWCWGFQKPMSFSDNQLPGIDSHLGGLLFKVQGLLFKGTVVVALNGKDLYDVYLGTFTNGKMTVKEKHADIYAEDLNGFIDGLVERKAKVSA